MRTGDPPNSAITNSGEAPPKDDPAATPLRYEIHIPFVTFCRAFAAILFAAAAYRLWPLFLLVLLSILLAITLNSMVQWFVKKGFKRRSSLAIVLSTVLTCMVLGGVLCLPVLLE